MKLAKLNKHTAGTQAQQLLERRPGDVVVLDSELLPSFDGSNHYLQLFLFPANFIIRAGERYYFEQNSKIDGCKLSAVQVHYKDAGGFGGILDMFTTYKVDATDYHVILLADYTNLLLTLVDSQREQSIERCPASTFIVRPSFPLSIGGNGTPKSRKPLDIFISTNRSFIEFTADIRLMDPLCVPVSFYYRKK